MGLSQNQINDNSGGGRILVKGQLTRNSFAEVEESLADVIAWLSSFGVNIPSTRIHRYESAIRTLRRINEIRDEAAAEEYLPTAINTLHEVHDLIEVRRGFADCIYNEFLAPKITELASGPDAYADENSSASNRARNIAFELIVASKLASSGLPLFRQGTHDLATKLNNRNVLIECKRPFAEQQIGRRIKEGFSQLERGYKGVDSIRTRGIVAVDVTRAHNPLFQSLTYANPNDLGRVVEEYLTKILQNYEDVMNDRRSKKTIGLIFRVSAMALPIGNAVRVSYCQQFDIRSYERSSKSAKKIMQQLYEKMTAH